MTVKVVTDSTADIPSQMLEDFDISVVPAYTRFGEDIYKDGVEISKNEFYSRLLKDPVHPATTQPSPQDFAEVFKRLADDADGIISIDVTSKLSGTYNSALQAVEAVAGKCPVAVVDSQFVSMALGILVLEAARLAKAGKGLEEIVTAVKNTIPRIQLLICFDTLKYLAMGGRIGKVKHLMGSILNIKPIVSVQDGELVPSGQVRTHKKGVERLIDFASKANNIQELAVIYSTTPDEGAALADRLGSVFPREKIMVTQLSPALGVHAGPGVLGIGVREGA
jgi:DegV family protein with EDD domain